MTNLPRIRGMVAYGTPAETAQYYDLNFASVGVSTETGTDYTFRPTDSGGWVRFTSSSAVTATIAPFLSIELPFGAVIMVEQAGTGLVTIAAGAGVTVYGVSSVPGQYSVLRLVNLARNVWSVTDGGGAGSSSTTLYASRSSAELASVEPTVDAIQTAGFAAAGDGGAAIYYRAGGSTIGGFQSFDGAWWGLAGNATNVRWTLIGDTNATISPSLGDLDTMNRFATSAAFTAARTWTLPAASAVPPSWPIAVLDLAGALTNVNTLTIARAGSDTIAGQASLLLSTAYDGVVMVSDGISAWAVESAWRNRASQTRFYANIDNGATITTPRILLARERIFVGAAVDYSTLNQAGNATFGWLGPTVGPSYLPRDASVAVVNDDAGIAISGASRSSDVSSGQVAVPIGVAGFGLADAASSSAWAFYGEAIRQGTGSFALGLEIDVRNSSGQVPGTSQPYSIGSGPHGLWIACGPGSGSGGYGPAPTNDSGAAMVVLQNLSGSNLFKFSQGIIFRNESLSGVTGADGDTGRAGALDLARGHEIRWYSADGTVSARISSRQDNANVDVGIEFTGGNVDFLRNGLTELAFQILGNASAVNYLRVQNQIAGAAPSIDAAGTDTNINVSLTPQGTGFVRSGQGSFAACNAVAIPAGGTAGKGFLVSSTTNFGVFFGSGAPGLAAAKGSLYLRSDGSGTNDRMYVNTNGSTTWTAVVTVA